jgi:hypothetical protein
MSFLPEFEDDIFISYAHIDDRPLTEGQKGWISNFHQALETRLAQLLVPEPGVWRDLKLRGNDDFAEKLVSQLPKIAVLVSVISPRYIGSEWCIREMREFYRVSKERRVAEQSRGIRIDDKSCIFKVVKTPVSSENQPPEIQGLLGYEFYQVEKQTGRPRELNPEVDPDTTRSYWRKLDDLAYDIHQLLESLKKSPEGTATQKAICVYLAETTFDLRDERDSVRRELQQRGYTVLPDGPLPSNAADFQNVVREYLKRSRLSIHLIGENYGDIPRTETRSLVYLQNELAAGQSFGPDFSRLIWMPVDLKATDVRQQQFIEYLQRNSAAQQGAELLQTNLEELKQVIQDKLTAKKEVAPAPVTPGSSPHIYLICDREDVAAIAPLHKHLYDLGYEPILPSFEGSETELREEHKDNLLLCDACLIYYGASNEFWLRSKLRDLQKIAGYGRTKPMSAKCIYIGPNETEHKRDFRTHDAVVIKNFDNFSPASLTPLLAQFAQTQSAKGGQS